MNDGCVDSNRQFISIESDFNLIALASLFRKEEKHIKANLSDGRIQKLNFNTIKSAHNRNLEFNNAKQNHLVKLAVNKNFHLFDPSHTDNNQITVLNENTNDLFMIVLDRFYGNSDWKSYTNNIMRRLIKSNPRHVIVDLTNNSGGSLYSASTFISYFLSKPHKPAKQFRIKHRSQRLGQAIKWHSANSKKRHIASLRRFRNASTKNGQRVLRFRAGSFGNPSYNGKITVLVSPNTRSAALFVAWMLQSKRNANVVGYLNAPKLFTFCSSPDLSHILPNTRILVKIPFVCFDRQTGGAGHPQVLKPDIEVDPMTIPPHLILARIFETALDNISR